MRVLIVDNHRGVRRLLRHYIDANFGNKPVVNECASGDEAITLYSSLKPDCVLMDIELGAMSGFEAIARIRQIDMDAMVIIVSSYNSPLYQSKAKELNVQGYVCKENLHELPPLMHSLIN